MIEEVTEKLALLLQGRIPAKIDVKHLDNKSEQKLGEMLNQLIAFIKEIHDFIFPLSQGVLQDISLPPKNFLASPFKELHSHLLHLTWQAKQVADGDYSQRVDFMGDFSEAFNSMIVSLDRKERMLREKIAELEKALSRIRKLEGFLPICSNCKRIRIQGSDPENPAAWMEIEDYITSRSDAQFSHSICPECQRKLYPDI